MINTSLIQQAAQVPDVKVDLVTPFLKGQQLAMQRQEHEAKAQESTLRITKLQEELAKNARLNAATGKAVSPDGSVDMNTLQAELIKADPANAPEMMKKFSAMKKEGLELAIKSSEAGLHAIGLFRAGDTEGGLSLWNQANPKMSAKSLRIEGNKAILTKEDGADVPIDLSLLEKTVLGAKKLAEHALDLQKESAKGGEARKTEELKQEHRKELVSGRVPIKHADGTVTIGIINKAGELTDTGEQTTSGKEESAFSKSFREAQEARTKKSDKPVAAPVAATPESPERAGVRAKLLKLDPSATEEQIQEWMKVNGIK